MKIAGIPMQNMYNIHLLYYARSVPSKDAAKGMMTATLIKNLMRFGWESSSIKLRASPAPIILTPVAVVKQPQQQSPILCFFKSF